jgi:hypothetical protein
MKIFHRRNALVPGGADSSAKKAADPGDNIQAEIKARGYQDNFQASGGMVSIKGWLQQEKDHPWSELVLSLR